VKRSLRLFTDAPADGDTHWTELTSGDGPVVRVSASDLRHAQQLRNRLRAEPESADSAVVLDITVSVADSFRAARLVVGDAPTDAIQYVGTVDGLAGLVRDIFAAEVADGVTLIPAAPGQDIRALALATLAKSGLQTTGEDGRRRTG